MIKKLQPSTVRAASNRDVRFGYLGTKSLKFGYFELRLVTLVKNKSLTNSIILVTSIRFFFGKIS